MTSRPAARVRFGCASSVRRVHNDNNKNDEHNNDHHNINISDAVMMLIDIITIELIIIIIMIIIMIIIRVGRGGMARPSKRMNEECGGTVIHAPFRTVDTTLH